jgi:DNA processing protein
MSNIVVQYYHTMSFPILKVDGDDIPELLHEIPDPPRVMYLRGTLPPQGNKILTVVGSRAVSAYGRDACKKLVEGLRGYPISIVSGLAIGTDSVAHESALEAGLHTIAVPGSGIDDSVLYPARNKPLAKRILEAGGGMLSEFDPLFKATQYSFPQRNRIMAGIAHATLVIEAGEQSGTLITARLATDFNRDLLCVPHPIFSDHGKGPHLFIRLGAILVRDSGDILEALGFEKKEATVELEDLSPLELRVYEALHEPKDRDALLRELDLPAQEISTTLMMLELKGIIKESVGSFHRT